MAVLFGATISVYLPQAAIFALVGMLFLVFGVQSLRVEDDEEEGELNIGRHLLLSVFVLIFLAELGDKTQLSIAGLSAVENAWIVWLAGTSALLVTTLLGVWVGAILTSTSVHYLDSSSGRCVIYWFCFSGFLAVSTIGDVDMIQGFLILLVCQLVGELIVTAASVPIPGSVVGMVLLLVGLIVRGEVPEGAACNC